MFHSSSKFRYVLRDADVRSPFVVLGVCVGEGDEGDGGRPRRNGGAQEGRTRRGGSKNRLELV